MIRIQEHLNRADADAYLESLATKLWENLNKKQANGRIYKDNSLIQKCRFYRDKTTDKEYVKKYAHDDKLEAQRHRAFFKYLLADRYKELKRLIMSKPMQLDQVIADAYNILKPSDVYTMKGNKYESTPFGTLLLGSIFNYKAFRSSAFCRQLFLDVGFKSTTCPYCNDKEVQIVQLTMSSSKALKHKAYLDLDHFYSKVANPFLALSFYNLVPSCHDCNSADKGEKPFTISTHIHPYFEAFDDEYDFKVSLMVLLGDPVDKIDIVHKGKKVGDRTLVDLELMARYDNNREGVEALVKFFLNHRHKLGTPDEQIFIDGIFDLHQTPRMRTHILKFHRGKLKRDTLKQLDISNNLGMG
ncbi:hypothetical protein EPD60_07120 [Flaviaesturariibacter flavus]|uniref:HNH nuclease domain-containing protein n=1 Tax=Flaviaesturariibacter flavus TaxID=2502780 RepID=A0A4R1BID3_9BACT|nr:hypothetical protein [Flaviaesturariibacter flavus]TCJ17075.1 hypothetical protein EPD60_07120 [Flaviaesturariibacter flavus]